MSDIELSLNRLDWGGQIKPVANSSGPPPQVFPIALAAQVASMLLFKKKFLPDIRSGVKQQTIRLWRVARMRDGQFSYIPGAGYIRVVSVEPVELAALDEDDALRDGFSSLAELLAELAALYTQHDQPGWRPYRVRFELLPPAEQQERRRQQQLRRQQKLRRQQQLRGAENVGSRAAVAAAPA